LDILVRDKKKVFVENKNAEAYNTLGFENSIFLGEVDKNSIFLRIEQDKENLFSGLIDRDYLTDLEINNIKQKFPNLYILKYYCFENYLYHPENLSSALEDFDKKAYIQRIREEKNRQKNNIIANIKNDRKSYVFFKGEKKYQFQEENLENLFSMLENDDFETFLKY